jgi:hypothetical protein
MVACASVEPVMRTITTADIGNVDATRVTTYLTAPDRSGNPTEETVGSVPKTALADDASILQARGDEVCFSLILRNAPDLDVPLEQAKVTLDGTPATIKDEKVTVRDYSGSGDSKVLLEDLERNDWPRLPKDPPAQGTLRVFERSANGCAKMAGLPSTITLEVRIPKSDGKGDYGEKFMWKLGK